MGYYYPPREGHNLGYHVYLLVERREGMPPEAIRTYARVSDELSRSDAEALSDAIIGAIKLGGDSAMLLYGEWSSRKPWVRRLAQCGGIDEMSSGVQATYFSPSGLLVCMLAYVDAEWMDD